MITPEALMEAAIEVGRDGLAAGQSPFGCVIAVEGRIVAREYNAVVQATDVTAHAEMNAIRAANQALSDIFLHGAIVATTCEPCPMCMSALHWARVERVYYGATIADAAAAGFNELSLSAGELLRIGGSDVQLIGEILRDPCRELFAQWQANPERRPY